MRRAFSRIELCAVLTMAALLTVLVVPLAFATRARADFMAVGSPSLAAGVAGGATGMVDDPSVADVFKFSGASSTTSSSATSDTLLVNTGAGVPGFAQAEISAAGTVVLQGRISSSFSWVTMYTFTASGMVQTPRPTQMRVTVTANTGTVSAGVTPYGK